MEQEPKLLAPSKLIELAPEEMKRPDEYVYAQPLELRFQQDISISIPPPEFEAVTRTEWDELRTEVSNISDRSNLNQLFAASAFTVFVAAVFFLLSLQVVQNVPTYLWDIGWISLVVGLIAAGMFYFNDKYPRHTEGSQRRAIAKMDTMEKRFSRSVDNQQKQNT